MEVMHDRVAGLDVHKAMIVACVRLMAGGTIRRECRTFETSTAGLEALLDWLRQSGRTHVAMEATGVYRKPVWNILSEGDRGELLSRVEKRHSDLPRRWYPWFESGHVLAEAASPTRRLSALSLAGQAQRGRLVWLIATTTR